MSKIDVTKIEGYAEMSAEDKVKALEALELEEPDLSGYVSKDTFDKTASELANKKKELKAKMTEDEAKKLAEQEEKEALQKRIAELEKSETISKNKAQFLALGFDENMATSSAKALADGDLETVFKNQKLHQEAYEKKVRADVLAETPRPDKLGSQGKPPMTLSEFRKMSPSQKLKWAEENPEEYKEIYSTGG